MSRNIDRKTVPVQTQSCKEKDFGRKDMSKKILTIATLAYIVWCCIDWVLWAGDTSGFMDWLLIPILILAGVFVLLWVRLEKLTFPETLKPFCGAAIILSFFYPRPFLTQPIVIVLNYVADGIIVTLAVWYLVATRKKECKKWPMVLCLLAGILLICTDMTSMV